MIVTHLDTGRDWRGGQGQAWLLMQGLRARDVTCRLIAPRGPLLERARTAGFETRMWPARGDLDAGSAWRAWRWLATERADLVHAHSARAHALGACAARAAGTTPFVVSRRVDFRVDQNVFSRWKYRLPVDRYLCISRPVMEVMRAGGVPASRLALVPSGVTIDAAPPPPGTTDLRALIGAPVGAPVLGTVAALAPHKDHATLLEAVPRVLEAVPDAHFVWLGEGECRATLERRRSALGLEARVHMPGFRPDAKALLPQFTLFVLPSHLEGLCTSLLDAQVRGVPIVATRAGGIPDVIENGVTGALVPPRDPEALARELVEALADPARRAAWAAAARESVRRFSADAMVENTLAAYGEVLEGRTRARSVSISA